MHLYHWFAETRGWPPQVVDELTLDQVTWFPLMKQAHNRAAEQYQEQQADRRDGPLQF